MNTYSDAKNLIKKLKAAYQTNTNHELANKLGLTVHAIEQWSKKNKVPDKYIFQCASDTGVSMQWLLDEDKPTFHISGGSGNINNQTIRDNQTYKLFDLAFEVAKEKNNIEELENTIANFLALNIIKDKFQNMNKEMTFYNYILNGYKKRISNIILLAKVLSNSKVDVTIENAKEKLLELINAYKIELLKDKILHGLNDESKDNLVNWIDMNVDDIEAFVILKNIPIILKYLTENINYLNKLDLKILQLKNGG